ncbi:MAG: ROK family protein, partial [Plesiomonas sp.]
GDLLALTLLNEAARHIGQLLSTLVNLFHPEKILFGSPLRQAQSVLFPEIEATIKRLSYSPYTENLELQLTEFYNEGTMAGAGLVKEALYSGSLLTQLLEG